MTTSHDHADPAHEKTPAPAPKPHVALTEADYQTKKADLEQQLAALEAAHVPPAVEYPRWLYHATKPATIVQSAAEADALGSGWTPAPVGPEAAHATKLEKKAPS